VQGNDKLYARPGHNVRAHAGHGVHAPASQLGSQRNQHGLDNLSREGLTQHLFGGVLGFGVHWVLSVIKGCGLPNMWLGCVALLSGVGLFQASGGRGREGIGVQISWFVYSVEIGQQVGLQVRWSS
jgi:hypothetical protein